MATCTKTTAINLRKNFEGELMNAAKINSTTLPRPISLETANGTWHIVGIRSFDRIGPRAIVFKVDVIPPVETVEGMKLARLELDLREKSRSAELTIVRPW